MQNLFFKLSCGCIVLVERRPPDSTIDNSAWLTRTIERCVAEDDGDYFIGDSENPTDCVTGSKQINEGRYLTDDEAEIVIRNLNTLLLDGKKLRTIRHALKEV